MPAINTPASQILNKRKDNYVSLPQGSMKISRKLKLQYFPHSIIPKVSFIPTTLELESRYDHIK